VTIDATLRFLGTGGSLGTPMVGCRCAQCTSEDPKDHRLRSSVAIHYGDKTLLIDAGPDFRQQALTHNLNYLDGIILTHAHNDHTAGIDDLRAYAINSTSPLPCLLSEETLGDLKKRFHYIFEPKETILLPKFSLQLLDKSEDSVNFSGLNINYCTYIQAGMKVNGFRLGNLAYYTDIKEYDDSLFDTLTNLDILVISALRDSNSRMHLSIKEAIAFAKRVQAKKTYFTHISHEMGHFLTNEDLPDTMELAYDSLQVPFKATLRN